MTTSTTFIAFASPKGGAGKSTSCLSIAGALANKGHSVRIIDFDQNETLWRWYSSTGAKDAIPNLTAEKGPTENIGSFLETLLSAPQDYVLIDLAGMYSDYMLQIAGFTHITITPTKLSEPDVLEATRLSHELTALAKRIGKPIIHRILINERPTLLAAYQVHVLKQINDGQMTPFKTMLHTRAAYAEALFTGQPPHYADQSRPPVVKATQELDDLMAEIHALTHPSLESLAA